MRGGGIKNCQGGVWEADKGREDRQGCGKSEVVVGRFWVDIVEEGGWEAGNGHSKVRLGGGNQVGLIWALGRNRRLCTSLRWEF